DTESEDNAEDKEKTSGQEKSPSDEGAKDADDGERIEVEMPQMGESVMEGTVIEWSKEIGDQVEEDETLLEISTDKVDSEVPSPQAGTLVETLAEEGETIEVGQTIAVLTTGEVSEGARSEEHTSELQSRFDLVCRLLLEK